MIRKITPYFLVPLLFFFSTSALAQLQKFDVTATKTNDETCANNGAISWVVSKTTAGSTLTYSVVNTATNAPVATTSGNVYTSLAAGNYKVVATQTLGGLSNQATSSIISIINKKVTLSAIANVNSDEICGNDGQFTITAKGTAPYQYQLLDASFNVIATQSSGVFTGLSAGEKNYRVIDACGQGVAGNVTIKKKKSIVEGVSLQFAGKASIDCSEVTYDYFTIKTNLSSVIKFPVTVNVKYTNPNTNQSEVKEFTYNSVSGGTSTSSTELFYNIGPLTLPFFSNVDELPTEIKITDGCGVSYNFNYIINNKFRPSTGPLNSLCGSYYRFAGGSGANNVQTLIKVTYVSGGPQNFDPAAYDSDYGTFQLNHLWGSATQPLPYGTYTVDIEDVCGRKVRKDISFTVPADSFRTDQLASCTVGLGGIRIFFLNGNFSKAELIGAPAAYTATHTLPFDFTSSISSVNPSSDPSGKYFFSFADLPPGLYTYKYTNTCDSSEKTRTFTIAATKNNSTITSSVSCGNVDYVLNGDFSPQGSHNNQTVLLQKFYPGTNDWSTPASYIAPNPLNPYPATSYGTSASVKNLTSGVYRFILRSVTSFDNENSISCYKIMQGFDITGLSLDNAYAFQCGDGTYDVAISASKGSETGLTYSIVSDLSSSATVVINNGNNPLFHGLAAGSYYFRVSDACGNFLTRKLDVTELGKPGISLITDCSTTPGSIKMTVNGLSYLQFKWYKTTDPTTILSTSPTLDLGPFTSGKEGIYKVQIYSDPSLNYCINYIESMQLTPEALTNGNPGTGQTVNIVTDNTLQTVDLFDYLTGPYDGYGTWEETTNPSSNLVTGHSWNIALASSGTYTFKYTTTPACGGLPKSTTVQINLTKKCYIPVTNNSAGIPVNFGITLLERAGADNGGWPMNRTSAHAALESNTKGFVITRVPTAGLVNITKPVEGMIVYDTDTKCLKIYVVNITTPASSGWKCFSTPACP